MDLVPTQSAQYDSQKISYKQNKLVTLISNTLQSSTISKDTMPQLSRQATSQFVSSHITQQPLKLVTKTLNMTRVNLTNENLKSSYTSLHKIIYDLGSQPTTLKTDFFINYTSNIHTFKERIQLYGLIGRYVQMNCMHSSIHACVLYMNACVSVCHIIGMLHCTFFEYCGSLYINIVKSFFKLVFLVYFIFYFIFTAQVATSAFPSLCP